MAAWLRLRRFFILGINREIPRHTRLGKLSNDCFLENLHPLHNTKAKYDTAEQGIKKRRAKAERLDAFVTAIKEQGTVVTEFDEGLWGTLVDFMTVYSKEDISVTSKDGTEIHID